MKNTLNEIADLIKMFDENPELMDDFVKFNDEIDRVKNETGMSEDDAVAYVQSYWEVPNIKD